MRAQPQAEDFWTPLASGRLGLALAASAALHAGLLLGVQVEQRRGASRSNVASLVVRLDSPVEHDLAAALPLFDLQASPVPAPELALARVPAPPLPRYFRAAELDRRPTPVTDILPEFPREAAVRTGRVRVRVLINEQGIPDQVVILKAEPAGVFDESARAAFGTARYSPGMAGGVAVKSELLVEVEYEDPANRQSRFASDRASY